MPTVAMKMSGMRPVAATTGSQARARAATPVRYSLMAQSRGSGPVAGRLMPWRPCPLPLQESSSKMQGERPCAATAAAAGTLSPEVEEGFYEWRHGWRLHWERAGTEGPALLLVPGFGAGTFHYTRNIRELARTHRVWSVDLLGQGQSWPPEEPEDGEELCYSASLWREQLFEFINQVVGEPVYMAGNSLGGLLSVYTAAEHPEVVRGIILLNATPFWAFNPNPETSPILSKIIPWDGTAPAPAPLKLAVGKLWWDNLRAPASIRRILGLVYASSESIDDFLVDRIIEPTENPRALEAFTSIAFAPKPAKTFDEMLEAVSCPVCLLYGKEDPWVVPLWGQRVKRTLPGAAYYEVSPAGHCVHHEAPEAVNQIMSGWIESAESGTPPPLHTGAAPGPPSESGASVGTTGGAEGGEGGGAGGGAEVRVGVATQGGREVVVSAVDGSPRNLFERYDDLVFRVGRALGFGKK